MHNHPCMYIVPNVWDKVYNCHNARRSSLICQCTGMGQGLQLSQRTEVLPNMSVHRYGNDTTVIRVSYRILSWGGGATGW